MPVTIHIGAIDATAGTEIDLAGKLPAPIAEIVSARILQGHTVNEGGTATYDIFTVVDANASIKGPYTITLDKDITTKDVLELVYIPVTEKPKPETIAAVFDPQS